MGNYIFKSDLVPNNNLIQEVGSSSTQWKVNSKTYTNGIYCTEDTDYGDELPINGEEGQIFFKFPEEVNEEENTIDFDTIFPVGTIYLTVGNIDPATMFGGTWSQIQDKFLLCAGSTYAAGSTGGSTTMDHTHSQVAQTSGGPSNNTSGSTALSVGHLPSHNHGSVSLTGVMSSFLFSSTTVSGFLTSTKIHKDSYSNTDGDACRKVVINATHTHDSQGSGSGHTHSLNSHTHSTSATNTGGASNTNNLPPYLAVYMWQRTA